MITPEEAADRARAWLGEGKDDQPEIGLYEFPGGWVSWIEPPPGPPGLPPASTGGPQIVVDRESGDITRWPSISPSAVAEQYEKVRAATDRFPVDVARVLLDAGWHPGRDISPQIDAWVTANSDKLPGGRLADVPRAFLNEFGGLDFPQYGPHQHLGGGYDSTFHPMTENILLDRGQGIREEYGITAYPIGINADDAELVMDVFGRMFFVHWSDDFLLGHNPDEALINLVRGSEWPRLSDPGVRLPRPAEDRFPPDVAQALLDAGWSPWRDVSDQIGAWVAANSDKLPGGTLADAPRAFLDEFGGLTFRQLGTDGQTSEFHPAARFPGRGPGFTEERGIIVFPLGTLAGDELLMDEEGQVFLVQESEKYLLGWDPDEALIELVRNRRVGWPTVDEARL